MPATLSPVPGPLAPARSARYGKLNSRAETSGRPPPKGTDLCQGCGSTSSATKTQVPTCAVAAGAPGWPVAEAACPSGSGKGRHVTGQQADQDHRHVRCGGRPVRGRAGLRLPQPGVVAMVDPEYPPVLGQYGQAGVGPA